jgi:CMP/dCMP kinase
VTLPKTIAVDGPAGSGKSSIGFMVAEELGYLFVDTGAFYRAVTLAALRANAADADEATVIELARCANLDITNDRGRDGRQYTVLLNGEDVSQTIREPAVELYVSRISAMPGVRDVLNRKYRELAGRGNVLMVGRDIGTVVLPDADLKIYLDASTEARADRRYRERIAAGKAINYDEILSAMQQRDWQDSKRGVAPLQRAVDAEYLNTNDLDMETAIEQVRNLIVNWQPS